MKKLNGIFTALLTPFDENNKINEKSLEKRFDAYRSSSGTEWL